MNLLKEIVEHKRKEVLERKELYPIRLLEKSLYFSTPVVSLKGYLSRPDKFGVIAEIKRKSPSKGQLKSSINVEKLSIGYMQAGASALSILTDNLYFGGTNDDVTEARRFNYCPILRKEFIVDEYQIFETKSIGADAILLIASILTPEEVKNFGARAKQVGLEVLLEIHTEAEFKSHYTESATLIGINNRNLDSLSISVDNSFNLIKKLPKDISCISESGISDPETLGKLKKAGFKGFLIGEAFLKSPHPERACEQLIQEAMKKTI